MSHRSPIDPDVWQQPALRAALAERDIGTVYRLLNEAGVSQRRIAELTGQHPSEVHEVLRGRAVINYDVLVRIATGLGVPRGWMGLAYDPEPEPEEEPKEAQPQDVLRQAGSVLFGKAIFGPAAAIPECREQTPVPRRIGLSDVKQIEAVTTQFRDLGHAHGDIPIVASVTAHARAAEALLGADMSEQVRQHLLRALAEVHDIAGWATGSTGLRDLARRHFARGMRCARAAGDRAWLVVNVYGEGRMELHFGQPNDALKLFQLGLVASDDLGSALARSLFEANCAWTLAKLRLPDEALAALRRARNAHDAAGADEPACLGFFDRSHLLGLSGFTLFALDCWEPAAEELAAASSGWPAAEAPFVVGDLAAAQLRTGDVGAGLRSGGRALELARRFRSVRVLDRLGPLQEAAAARRDSGCRDLANELAAVRATA